jgi:hypothetical protein
VSFEFGNEVVGWSRSRLVPIVVSLFLWIVVLLRTLVLVLIAIGLHIIVIMTLVRRLGDFNLLRDLLLLLGLVSVSMAAVVGAGAGCCGMLRKNYGCLI